MKKILFTLLLMILSVFAYSQEERPGEVNTRFKNNTKLWTNDTVSPFKIDSSTLKYVATESIPNKAKNEIFNAEIYYLTTSYMGGKAELKYKDIETGKIIISNTNVQTQGSYQFEQTITTSIDVRDNGIRCIIVLANLHIYIKGDIVISHVVIKEPYALSAPICDWYPIHSPMYNAKRPSWVEKHIPAVTKNNMNLCKILMNNILTAAKNASSDEW